MALIYCPECNKEVSDSAASCPFCGFKVSSHVKRKKAKQKVDNLLYPITSNIITICKFSFVIAVLICLIVSSCLWSYYDSELTKAQKNHDNTMNNILTDSANTDINSFRYMAKQNTRAEEMELNKSLTFPIALGILAVVELVIFIIYKKANSEASNYFSQIEERKKESQQPENNKQREKWEEALKMYGRHIGKCEMCGSRKTELVYSEFKSYFDKVEYNLCYNCFSKHDATPKQKKFEY